MPKIQIPLDKLTSQVIAALATLGLDKAESEIVCDVLLYAEKRGGSQGLIKIKERTVLPDNNCSAVTVDNKSSAIAKIDGGGHTGMFVLHAAMQAAAEMVKQCGITLVTTANTRSSTGSIGYYARHLAEHGLIGIVLAGSPKVMALEGGIDPVLGTNPIAIAIPTTHKPLVFDTATAAITWFSVINARDQNRPLPENVAFDNNGIPTTDPLAAMNGALRSVAGAKGSGLALMFEMLTAPLAGAAIAGDRQDNRGNTIMAINPVLLDVDYLQRTSTLISRIKSTRSADPVNPLRLPGEAGDAAAKRCEERNLIEIDKEIYRDISALAAGHP